MNRRDFLQGPLARGAGQVLGALEEMRSPEPPPAEVRDISLLRIARRAMGTQFEIVLPFGTPQALAIAETALDEIDRLEQQLTVYHDHSEVSRLNRLAASRPVVVEERLFGLLTLAAQITRDTAGAFDITTGALTKAWGFFRRRGRVPSDAERAEALSRVGMQYMMLDPERRSVQYQCPGLEINLGSIGKGYALDRAAELLRTECGVAAGLLHGGHSSIVALGADPSTGRGWEVGIRHPWNPERRLGVVRLRDRAVGTSAATFQHLEYNGRKLGHILDPRSGWPAEGLASASVVAPTAAEADALATAFFILGVEPARAYCAAHPGIGAVLLPAGDAAQPVVLGLEPSEVDLMSSGS